MYTGTTEGTCTATLGNAVSGSSFSYLTTAAPVKPALLTQSAITITSGADRLVSSSSSSSSVSSTASTLGLNGPIQVSAASLSASLMSTSDVIMCGIGALIVAMLVY